MRTYSSNDIGRILARRRWVILLPFAIGLAAAPLLAPFAPERYRSETLILVVPQRVPDAYVKPTVTESVETRLPAISEQIMSRSRLERIIQEMDLYRDLRAKQVMEDVVAQMRNDVKVSLASSRSGGETEVNSFTVSYVSDKPQTAHKVTERLASLYINQNLTDREDQAERTSQFLDSQLQEAKRRLIDQEKKLEEYRRRNAGQLPSQLQGNLQAIQSATLQLQSLNEATNRALERRLLLERQIADIQATPVPPTVIAGVGSETPVPASTAQQLEIARARLAVYLQRYTPEHFEVVSLQRTIADLMKRLEQETPVSVTQAVPERVLTPEEAAQKKRVLDLQGQLAVVDHQLSSNRAEHERLKAVVASYQTKVDAVPTRESELVELTRDYSTLQTAYASLLLKKEDSKIAANLERGKIGEQFDILDPASMPQRPDNQRQRLLTMSAGAMAGLLLGVLVTCLLELRDSSFRREEDVYASVSLPVLAMIPEMSSTREQRAARWRTRLMDVAGVAVMFAAGAVLVVWRLHS